MVVWFTTTYVISAYHHWSCVIESSSDDVYSIQLYVIKFVSDLREVSGFLWVLKFPPQIKLKQQFADIHDNPLCHVILITSQQSLLLSLNSEWLTVKQQIPILKSLVLHEPELNCLHGRIGSPPICFFFFESSSCVLCAQCCHFLWIAHFWLPFRCCLTFNHIHSNTTKYKKYYTARTVPKSNKSKSIPIPHIYMTAHCLGLVQAHQQQMAELS